MLLQQKRRKMFMSQSALPLSFLEIHRASQQRTCGKKSNRLTSDSDMQNVHLTGAVNFLILLSGKDKNPVARSLVLKFHLALCFLLIASQVIMCYYAWVLFSYMICLTFSIEILHDILSKCMTHDFEVVPLPIV